MPDKPFSETLWKLAEDWPCDYVEVDRSELRKANGPTVLRAFQTIKIHHDDCRKCNLRRHLIRLDELLKRTAEANYDSFLSNAESSDEEESEREQICSEEAFNALAEHAQHVRDNFLGCPRG